MFFKSLARLKLKLHGDWKLQQGIFEVNQMFVRKSLSMDFFIALWITKTCLKDVTFFLPNAHSTHGSRLGA